MADLEAGRPSKAARKGCGSAATLRLSFVRALGANFYSTILFLLTVGLVEGLAVGLAVGTVGWKPYYGDVVGPALGLAKGDAVGEAEGAAEGLAVGLEDGEALRGAGI